MTKNQKILIFGALGVFLALAALIVVLIVKNAEHTKIAAQLQQQSDSLLIENDRLELANLTSEFDRLNMQFDELEAQKLEINNDSLLQQYNEARERLAQLQKELEKERQSNKANREKIRQLENEITTLKGIARHYLEEIRRLNDENEGLRQELSSEKDRNQNLARENATVSKNNAELQQTVNLAKKLSITGLSLNAYNKKDKNEKNITKAKKLGVSFTVTPNNTAASGMKNFYVRIISPEGSVLGSGPTFNYDGASVASTAMRQLEYDNGELRVDVYWNVNTTLTPGDYTVEVFADGYRLGTGRFNMKK